jgi:triacylglycerol lipase
MRVIAASALVVATVCAAGLTACTSETPTGSEVDYIGYTSTRYPIVLIPGFLGFKTMFAVGDYFHGIPEALTADGARVYVVGVSQAESSPVRSAQIIPQLEAIKAETGADKLNLIGHSAGSIDARYIAATRPDLVASVTSISGPHKGTPIADLIGSNVLGDAFIGGAADLMKLVSGSPYPNDAAAAMQQMSVAGMTAFDAQFPAAVPEGCGEGAPVVDGIRYYSWGGTAVMTNAVDLTDPFLLTTSLLAGLANDGLVPRCSTHLGLVIRDDYVANHIDEVNLLWGLVGLLGPNPPSLYRQQANRLKLAGL